MEHKWHVHEQNLLKVWKTQENIAFPILDANNSANQPGMFQPYWCDNIGNTQFGDWNGLWFQQSWKQNVDHSEGGIPASGILVLLLCHSRLHHSRLCLLQSARIICILLRTTIAHWRSGKDQVSSCSIYIKFIPIKVPRLTLAAKVTDVEATVNTRTFEQAGKYR